MNERIAERFPYDVPTELAERRDDFTGRRWVLDRLLTWVQTSRSTFLLTGGPGSGKSALAAHSFT